MTKKIKCGERLCWKISKNYIDNYLNVAQVNFISPGKEKFMKPLNFPEILAELQIFYDYYYQALSI